MQNPVPSKKTELDSDRIGWLLFKMATPVFIGMFVQTTYNVVNTIFVGHFIGTEAIAGLSIVFPLQMLAFGLGMMVGVGGLSVISVSIGAGDRARAERALGNSFIASVAVTLVIMLIVMPFTDFWLKLIGASPADLPYAHPYLMIIYSGAILNTTAMTLFALVRAEGNTRIGMAAMVSGAILNIILDSILIIWLRLGVRGAAIGTVTSQTLSLVILLFYYLSSKSYLKIHPANFKPDFKILKSMFAVGSASYVQTTGTSISSMILLHSVVNYGGDVALGAFGIVQRIMMFANMPALVIGQGLQPILGFNYGARRFGLGLKGIYLAYASSTVLCVLTFGLVFIFPGPLARIFSNDPALVSMSTYAARRVFLAMPLMGLVMVSQMIFQAIGRATKSFIAAIVRPVVFLIPAVLVMSHFFKLNGVFLSLPMADTLTFLLVVFVMAPVINEFRKAAARENKNEALSLARLPELEKTGNSGAAG
jgi:putative MATE family efflux protein